MMNILLWAAYLAINMMKDQNERSDMPDFICIAPHIVREFEQFVQRRSSWQKWNDQIFMRNEASPAQFICQS